MTDGILSRYDWRKGLAIIAILTIGFTVNWVISDMVDPTQALLVSTLLGVFLIVLYVRRDATSLKLVGILTLILFVELAATMVLHLPKRIPGFFAMPVAYVDLFFLLWVASKVQPS